jgi:hypothetical protein
MALAAQPEDISNSLIDREVIVLPQKAIPGKDGMRPHNYSFGAPALGSLNAG